MRRRRARARPSLGLAAGATLTTTIVLACGGSIASSPALGAPSEDDPPTSSGAPPVNAPPPRDAGGDVTDAAKEVGPPPVGSLADGVCTHPYGHPTFFDPDCVYVLGTFAEGAAGFDVFFHPEDPEDHRGGTSENPGAGRALVRPRDNRLLYGGGREIWVFAPEAFAGKRYPSGPAATANDGVVSTPACPVGANLLGIFPDDSVVVYRCSFGSTYLEGSTTPLAGLELGLDAVGPMRTALVVQWGNAPKIWNNGVDVPIVGLPSSGYIASRHSASGFHVAYRIGATPVMQLWSVSLAGVASLVGDYRNPRTLQSGFVSALDPAGDLYRVSWETLHDRIVRFSLGADPVVVYDEQLPNGVKKPVKLHGAFVFSGP